MAQIKVQAKKSETVLPVYRDLLGQTEVVQRDLFLFKAAFPIMGLLVALSGVGWSLPAPRETNAPLDFPLEPVVVNTSSPKRNPAHTSTSELVGLNSQQGVELNVGTGSNRLIAKNSQPQDSITTPSPVKPPKDSKDVNRPIVTLVREAYSTLKDHATPPKPH